MLDGFTHLFHSDFLTKTASTSHRYTRFRQAAKLLDPRKVVPLFSEHLTAAHFDLRSHADKIGVYRAEMLLFAFTTDGCCGVRVWESLLESTWREVGCGQC